MPSTHLNSLDSVPKRGALWISVGLWVAAATHAGAQPAPIAYSVVDLGTLGGTYIHVTGLNSNGQVVGYATTNGPADLHAFIYSGGTMRDLGTLGGTNSYAYGINDMGQVVGGAYTSSGQEEAFLFGHVTMTDLGTLGGTASEARAINAKGEVAGGAWVSGDTEFHAFVYSAGAKTDLGTLGGTRSEAFGVNGSGQVVGRSSLSGISPQHAFLYSNSAMTDLGTLGGTESFAYGINDAGEVVGMSFTSTSDHAFRYSEGQMTDLGTLGGPGSGSGAYGINNHGQIVGYSTTSDLTEHAFVYAAGGKMTDLNPLIDPQAGWMLDVATCVNDQGQIAGIGTHPSGQLRGFLLTPVLSLRIVALSSNAVQLAFTAQANTGYVVEYRDSLSNGTWQPLVVVDPIPSIHAVLLTETIDSTRFTRFYRVRE